MTKIINHLRTEAAMFLLSATILGSAMMIGVVAHDGICWSGCAGNSFANMFGGAGMVLAIFSTAMQGVLALGKYLHE